MIEILVLQALAHEAQGDSPAALVPLERALSLAEPEGYVRIFVDEGLPMARLLHEAAGGTVPHYTQQLLTAFRPAAPAQTRQPDAQAARVQLLSEREREVLRQIAEGLTNREIADRLYLSCIRSRPMPVTSTRNSRPTTGRRPLQKRGNWASCLGSDHSHLALRPLQFEGP